ncbi:hypothetical protein GGI25_004470 [Coemansia spiralis]|uniref:Uncharacterized protein n=2 Tax=Coemansia TaxID=4863 RepID=A0A9W8G654_9FUNG|nr:hypothetical protein EDC05_004135 [Coemansia umbellata]KAJ2618688.1 hypothetical protein GGI26_006419 [Coemansia sp. RSA 1358]KAJ2674177.1 hypothetical protein GGI25_004470 [Coemansia spiralis]
MSTQTSSSLSLKSDAPQTAYPTKPSGIPKPQIQKQTGGFEQVQTLGSKSEHPALRALGKQGLRRPTARESSDLPAKPKMPHHMCPGLASPTDKIMSPASRGVNNLRHKKLPKDLPKPRVLGSLFESMKQEKQQSLCDSSQPFKLSN